MVARRGRLRPAIGSGREFTAVSERAPAVIATGRAAILHPVRMSWTPRATGSQPRSFLSTAKLESAGLRASRAIQGRTRMDQTCRGNSGRFWPMMRPLFQATRAGLRAGRRSAGMSLPPVHRACPSSVMPTATTYHVSGEEWSTRAGRRMVCRSGKLIKGRSPPTGTTHPHGRRQVTRSQSQAPSRFLYVDRRPVDGPSRASY
jgi:hypothetical protein